MALRKALARLLAFTLTVSSVPVSAAERSIDLILPQAHVDPISAQKPLELNLPVAGASLPQLPTGAVIPTTPAQATIEVPGAVLDATAEILPAVPAASLTQGDLLKLQDEIHPPEAAASPDPGPALEHFYTQGKTGEVEASVAGAPAAQEPSLQRPESEGHPSAPGAPGRPASIRKAPAAKRSPRTRALLVAARAVGYAALAAAPVLAVILGAPAAVATVAAIVAGTWAGRDVGRTLLEKYRKDNPRAYSSGLVLSVLAGGAAVALAAGALPAVIAAAGVSAALAVLSYNDGKFDLLKNAILRRPPSLFGLTKRGESQYIELSDDQFDKPFLLSGMVKRGLGEKGFYSTMTSDAADLQFAFTLKRYEDHVEMYVKNLKYRAKDGSAMGKTLERSIPDSLVASAPIVARDSLAGKVEIPLDALLAHDLFDFAPLLGELYGGSYDVASDLSRVEEAKGYPRNVEVVTRLDFRRDGGPGEEGPAASVLSDTRHLALTMHYSLSALPEDRYEPRESDDRIGYFATAFQDWSQDTAARLDKSLINRWKLEKVDPTAALSPVKEPIVFWMEDTVPPEYREPIKRGVLSWNKSFEKLGFKDAVQVRQVEPGMDFDPNDIRYNPIRYYLEADSGFAIANMRVDPFTGRIFNAGISVSAKHARYPFGYEFKDLDELADSDFQKTGRPCKGHACGYGEQRAAEMSMNTDLIEGRGGMKASERQKFLDDYMTDLAMHEAGHALGLRHNFLAKSWHTLKELETANPVSASSMDYTPVHIAPPGYKQGAYHNSEPGPYDDWAIEYGYRTFNGMDAAQKKAALSKIAARSAETGLAYATDEDLTELDPMIQQWTMGRDPLEYSRGRVALVRELWRGLEAKKLTEGQSYHAFYRSFVQGWMAYYKAVRSAVKVVGGIHFRRHHAGQDGGQTPYTPVPAAEQREVLKFLDEDVFSDKPFALSPDLLRKLAPDRQGTLKEPYPDLAYLPFQELVLKIRHGALEYVLDPGVLRVMMESGRMARKGEDVFTVDELLNGLSQSILRELYKPGRAPAKGKPKRTISSMRRELQEEYVTTLLHTAFPGTDAESPGVSLTARAHAIALQKRFTRAAGSTAWDETARAHFREAARMIQTTIENYHRAPS